jgi:hypothetical protein
MRTTQMTCEGLKRGSEKLFPLFLIQISFIYFSNFFISSNAKEKIKWWISG